MRDDCWDSGIECRCTGAGIEGEGIPCSRALVMPGRLACGDGSEGMERGAGVACVAAVACGCARAAGCCATGDGADCTRSVFVGGSAIFAAGPGLARLVLFLPLGEPEGFSEERSVRRLAMVSDYA